MPEQQRGTFTVPTHLYLTTEQRVKLEHLVRERQVELADLISEVVGEYLETVEVAATTSESAVDRREELRARRSELVRLRARRDSAGSAAPAWLLSYIADLEAEISRLERQ